MTPARLRNFPVSWFAMVMGLSGFSIAWRLAESALDFPALSSYLCVLSGAVFLLLAVAYALKFLRYRDAAVAEFRHPVKMSFVATFSVALVLLAAALLDVAPALSRYIWVFGASIHFLITLYVIATWLSASTFQIQHMNPAWFIPVVGNIIVPIAGVHHASAEISWFFFSVGVVFRLVLMTIIFYRVIFHDPLPGKLLPTLFILIAPPAIGFVAYVALVGQLDVFGRILYYVGLFLTLLLLTQIHRFARLPFALSWWAYSFPMAAITSATVRMYQLTSLTGFAVIAYILLVLLTVVIAFLFARTAVAVARQEICVEDN
ncbi:MAG: C4-dicarboxylate ABC transporter [Thiotrichales bacterium SG8_50]|nr:MAG: C4-dicarboxylate ABC transporter [Thiotrichales bacterium SG8_50]